MKKLSYKARKAMYGRSFISIWIIGVALFFAIPFVKTIIYSFNHITTAKNGQGLSLSFVGLEKFKTVFTVDADFLPKLSSSLLSLLYNVPLIVAFALFIAVILNRKFFGRTFFRAIFFFPVIAMSGTIMLLFKSDDVASMLFSNDSAGKNLFDNITVLQDIFATLGIGDTIINILQTIVGMVIDVCWSSGVQYLLCLAALQSIPSSLYEAAQVEGVTKWEEFWKITFPMSTPVLFLCVIYTIVQNTQGNNFTLYIKLQAFTNFDYAYASALSVLYFFVVLILVGIVSFVLRKWNENTL